jgi:hypothetical protein
MRIDWKKFSRDVRETMRNGYMGVRELDRETGINKATISRARHSKTMSAKSFMWICGEFDLDPWAYVILESRNP